MEDSQQVRRIFIDDSINKKRAIQSFRNSGTLLPVQKFIGYADKESEGPSGKVITYNLNDKSTWPQGTRQPNDDCNVKYCNDICCSKYMKCEKRLK